MLHSIYVFMHALYYYNEYAIILKDVEVVHSQPTALTTRALEYRSRAMWHAFGTLEHSRTFFMHMSHIIFKTLFCAFIFSLSLFSCCY